MEPLSGDSSSAAARPARVAVKHSAVICRYRMVFVIVFILRFAFLLLFFCFEVRRGQSRPCPIRVFEGQRPLHHSCDVSGGIVSLETHYFLWHAWQGSAPNVLLLTEARC